jgi:cytochrome c oxidase subunit IV
MSTNAEPAISTRTYFTVFGTLLALTALTVIAASFHFGRFNDVIALAIAGTKAILVVLYFMHLRHATGLTRVFVIAGLFWLGLLMLFTFADLVTRSLITPGA